MNFKRWLGIASPSARGESASEAPPLHEEMRALEERLRACESQLRERTEALYAMQRQYSAEHFELAESMRNLKIERMRNAGAYAAQDVVLERYRRLQARTEELKRRLRQYETVHDLHEDSAPIVIEES